MNIKTLLLLAALLLTTSMEAQQVSEQEALVKAQKFFGQTKQANAARGRAPRRAPELALASNRDEYYVFNDKANGGWVVISGDERMPNVLGYSYDGNFDADNIPCCMKSWIEGYVEEARFLRARPGLKYTPHRSVDGDYINPMLKCHWHQDAPYNLKCPTINDQHCATGCGATAMAQILYYHQWPKQTTKPIPAYKTQTKKIKVPELPVTTIDWQNIQGVYYKYTEIKADAVATLLQLCGASICMDYTLDASAFRKCIDEALIEYFDYNCEGDLFLSNIGMDTWCRMLYQELVDGRPVCYYGFNSYGGHVFVIDGYDTNVDGEEVEDYFHVNFGWGEGAADGFFSLTGELNGFNRNQYATFGIQPNRPDVPHAYATLEDGTFTLYYDTEWEIRSGKVFNTINMNKINLNRPWVDYCSEITACVIEESFSNYTYKNLGGLFDGFKNMKTIQGLNHINCPSNMGGMFYGCSSLTSLDLSGINSDEVMKMIGLFEGCSSLISLDVSGLNTENVESMGSMFQGCSSLKSLDVSKFNTEKVRDMGQMFRGCSSLTSLDVSGFKTDNVTYMEYMFENCSNLTSLDVSRFKTDKVKEMEGMFDGCSSLTSLDVSGFNTDKVSNMSWMFGSCEGLATIYVSEKWNMSNVEKSDAMFGGCYSIIGGAGTTYDGNHTDREYARIDEGPSKPGYFTYKGSTAIHSMNANDNNGYVYSLSGVRIRPTSDGLNSLKRGVYIVNGKKLIKD